MHLKLVNTAFQNLFSHHCAQGETEHHQALPAPNYSPSSQDPDFRNYSIQVVVGASSGMTKHLQKTFPRQELTPTGLTDKDSHEDRSCCRLDSISENSVLYLK
ncbi:hypothetical protein AB1E18_011058 [Capra hircus]